MLSNFRAPKIHYTRLDSDSDVKPNTGNWIKELWVQIVTYWRDLVIISLCIVCAILTSGVFSKQFGDQAHVEVQSYHITSDETRWKQFHWNTQVYSSHNLDDKDAVNAAWDQIVPAFGFVAVDHGWATAHNLPASMSLPSNASKGVYIIDAYHQLHCLTIIRKTLFELSMGQSLSVPIAHSNHCFDSLLQYIMCGNSGDTLLYTWGRNETGDGQLRKCIDWDSRKLWARQNTACYKDGDHPIPLFEHFDHCEIDDDGVRGGW